MIRAADIPRCGVEGCTFSATYQPVITATLAGGDRPVSSALGFLFCFNCSRTVSAETFLRGEVWIDFDEIVRREAGARPVRSTAKVQMVRRPMTNEDMRMRVFLERGRGWRA